MATAPLLSIGMIFKNEERCLERCLKSLEPLRKAIHCELVMADTGATDGSRGIAERYADLVFDFEWIDDFAAARNAVMDRCHGKWYLTIDCDEWLDTDISELLSFLKSEKKANYAYVIQRNYHSAELEKSEDFSNFRAMRLIRLSTGERYHGAIHEAWRCGGSVTRLTHTILHHDGYFFVDQKALKKKQRRNMKLLRQKLEQEPENLLVLIQCIESSSGDADLMQYARRAVELVQKKRGQWKEYGACLLRHAVQIAEMLEMPEQEEWTACAEHMFPDSIFTLVEVGHLAFLAAYNEKDWEEAIRYGEMYRKGVRLLHADPLPQTVEYDLGKSGLRWGDPVKERTIQMGLANAYAKNNQDKKALALFAELEGEKLDPAQVRNATVILTQLHAETTLDAAPALAAFYERITLEQPDKKKQTDRLAAFDSMAAAAFTKEYRAQEQEHKGWHRPAYTAFRCLADKCEPGRAAALMMAIDPEEICGWLAKVEDWQALPIEALEYALRERVAFPLPEKPLNTEAMSGLAARLTRGGNMARQIVLELSEDEEYPDLQSLFWAQSLVLAALHSFDWTLGKSSAPVSEFACPEKKNEEDGQPKDTPETGFALIRKFAQIESALLPILYTSQMLTEENAALLPQMHRWGLFCTLALEALDAGRPQEYLAMLRRGLAACPGEKNMVQFLLDRFVEDTAPKASPELLALAEKVKRILAAYDPADPAVAALKASPAYKQVAGIIEGKTGQPAQPALPAYPPARKPVRAVFFAELGEKWDAMQSVYEFMREDPRFDPVVVRTPVFRVVQQDGGQKQEVLYKDFLTPMGIPSLGYDEYNLASDAPDLAFISQPYESCTLPQFWPENIAKHTRLVYLPYFLLDKVAAHHRETQAQMPVYHYAWKVVCSGKKHYAFYRRHTASRGANALVTGLPKTDPIVALRKDPLPLPDDWEKLRGKTVFLWNSWYDISASSLRYFNALMEWFEAHRDCALIWRPHPLSNIATKLYYPDAYPAYQEMLRRADAAENVLMDRETSYLAAFAASEAMISDYSSLLPQYLPLDKPALWIRGGSFQFTGEEFIDSRWMEQARRPEEILAFLERIQNGEDHNAALRRAVLRRDLALADGHSGERVCEAVWTALREEGLSGA